MIKAKKIFGIVLAATIISSCGSTAEPTETTSIEVSTENLTVADYAIEGMVCAMGCAATIEKDVADIAGVVNSEVDYEAGKAHFEFDAAVVTEKEIIAKIESIADGQYKVNEWVETEKVDKESESEEIETSETEEEGLVKVSLPSFKIPNLFTLLLDQI
ncbi:MAG: heavy-metal-associated domain-containing protein [Vicingaceae bacterium]